MGRECIEHGSALLLPGEIGQDPWNFIMLLRMVHNLKLISYFCNFLFYTFDHGWLWVMETTEN